MPPPEPFKINWTAVGIIVGAAVTLCACFVNHRLARRRDAEAQARANERDAQAMAVAKDSTKQKSRGVALACIDRISLNVSTATYLPSILLGTRDELERLVVVFANTVDREHRERILAAWKPYAALKERHVHRDAHWTKRDPSGTVDAPKMRATMLDPLKKLRDEIERA